MRLLSPHAVSSCAQLIHRLRPCTLFLFVSRRRKRKRNGQIKSGGRARGRYMLAATPVPPQARWWMCVRPVVLACMLGTSAYVGRWPEDWYVPTMAAVAAVIPSSGAPVAGGIVFVPVLQAHGVAPRDAVAFSALTQLIGCGVLTPLNWLAAGADVFDREALRASLAPASIGALASLTVLRVRGCHADHIVATVFACFCGALATYCFWLLRRTPSPTASQRAVVARIPRPIFAIACVAGGMLTGYIGVAIEKVLFVLLTLEGSCVRRATLTSITAVGWVSAVAVATHALSSPDPSSPSYIGVPPVRLWLVALPGVMIGSMLGPHVHRWLGATTVLSLFTAYLVAEFLLGIYSSMTWRGALECV